MILNSKTASHTAACCARGGNNICRVHRIQDIKMRRTVYRLQSHHSLRDSPEKCICCQLAAHGFSVDRSNFATQNLYIQPDRHNAKNKDDDVDAKAASSQQPFAYVRTYVCTQARVSLHAAIEKEDGWMPLRTGTCLFWIIMHGVT